MCVTLCDHQESLQTSKSHLSLSDFELKSRIYRAPLFTQGPTEPRPTGLIPVEPRGAHLSLAQLQHLGQTFPLRR